jgi:drug/metabolite transporter (DMT)-like permease
MLPHFHPGFIMSSANLVRLLVLASIWGGSLLCMRILAPVLGAVWTAELRVLIAGAAMLLFMLVAGRPMDFRANWKSYLMLGLFNSALPFVLYAYAAFTLPVGYLAIVNATAPLWGALLGLLVLREQLGPRKIGGLLLGVAGVGLLVRLGPVQVTPQVLLAVAACAGAALCYGIASVWSKKASIAIAPTMQATGSQLAAALMLLPFVPFAPVPGMPTTATVVAIATLALLCTAVAYFIFFRLLAEIGTRALSVTFLIPVSAMAWGALFLDETITLHAAIGCALVMVATWLVIFQPARVSAGLAGAPATS